MDDQPETYEIEHGHDAYTDEELLEQAQFNAQALLLASVAALEGGSNTLQRWTEGVAEVFLRGWDRDREWRPGEILDALLTNYRSFGATVIEVNLDAAAPSAIIADLPDLTLAESLGVPEEHADAIFRIGVHIATALGHTLEWQRVGETGDVRLVVS